MSFSSFIRSSTLKRKEKKVALLDESVDGLSRPAIPPRTSALYDDSFNGTFIEVDRTVDPSMHKVDTNKFVVGRTRKRTGSLQSPPRSPPLHVVSRGHSQSVSSRRPPLQRSPLGSTDSAWVYPNLSIPSTSGVGSSRDSPTKCTPAQSPQSPSDADWRPRTNRSSPVRLSTVPSHSRVTRYRPSHPPSPPSISSLSSSTSSSLSEESLWDLEEDEEGEEDWSALSLFPQPPPFAMPPVNAFSVTAGRNNSPQELPAPPRRKLSDSSSFSAPAMTPDSSPPPTPSSTPTSPNFPRTPPRSILKKPSLSFSMGVMCSPLGIGESSICSVSIPAPSHEKEPSDEIEVVWGVAV